MLQGQQDELKLYPVHEVETIASSNYSKKKDNIRLKDKAETSNA